MMDKKPVIAVYDDYEIKDGKKKRRHGVHLICHYIKLCGGIPALVAYGTEKELEIMQNIGGMVFSGGGDINPAIYGHEKHEKTVIQDDEKDRWATEEIMARFCFKTDIPTVAICRGMQLMNVMAAKIWNEDKANPPTEKGWLIQDIASQFPDAMKHKFDSKELCTKDVIKWQEEYNKADDDKKPAHPLKPSHYINIEPDSVYASIVGETDNVACTSYHHQAVSPEGVSPQLIPTAYPVENGKMDKRIIEAAEYKNILLFQSHMETGVGNQIIPVFNYLVERASEYLMNNKGTCNNPDIMIPFILEAEHVLNTNNGELSK